jgi:hypothetical protein
VKEITEEIKALPEFVAILVPPYVLIAAGFFFVLRAAYRSKSPARPLFLYPASCAFFITIIFIIWANLALITSRSSTAAIGHIFLPFYSITVAVAVFLVSWSVFYLTYFVVERVAKSSNRLTSTSILLLALLILALTGFTVQDRVARYKLLHAAASTDESPRAKILERVISTHDLALLSELAKNPSTPVNDLIRIYDSCKNHVEFNPPEYKVFFSLAQNPQTPPEILTDLAGHQEISIRSSVGTNPGTPIKILYHLANDEKSQIRTWLTSNPKIPKELLLQLSNDPDRMVRDYAQSYLRYRGLEKGSKAK